MKLIFGDCFEKMKEIPDQSIDLILADPPYGINYHHGGKPLDKGARSNKHVEWGSILNDDFIDKKWISEALRITKNGGALYLCCRQDVEPEWREALINAGWTFKQRLVWHKRVHGKGDLKGTFAPTCEDVLFASKGRHILNSRPSMMLDAGCVPTWEHRLHPHQKPIRLFESLIEVSSKINETILDPFMGSGTIGMACMNTNRNFIGIEIDSNYFEVAKKRIESHMYNIYWN